MVETRITKWKGRKNTKTSVSIIVIRYVLTISRHLTICKENPVIHTEFQSFQIYLNQLFFCHCGTMAKYNRQGIKQVGNMVFFSGAKNSL